MIMNDTLFLNGQEKSSRASMIVVSSRLVSLKQEKVMSVFEGTP